MELRRKLSLVTFQVWRGSPGWLLVLYLVLYAMTQPTAFSVTQTPEFGHKPSVLISLPWFVLVPFLAWRVWRGGRISRVLLIMNSVLGYAITAFHVAQSWQPLDLWQLVSFAAQVALLVSPAVYRRTRRGAEAWTTEVGSLAGRPRSWMIPWSLLAGLVLTLLLVFQTHWVALPGCGPARTLFPPLGSRCIRVANGSPLRFLTADQGTPEINKTALVKDWVQWSLVSASVMYAFYLIRSGRSLVADPQPQLALPG